MVGGRRRASDPVRPWHERAQTAQDFAFGMGIFVIAIAFVFAFIPGSLTFTVADPGPEEVKQAHRASLSMLEDLADDAEMNRLNGTATGDFFGTHTDNDALLDQLVLPKGTQINVSVRSIHDQDVLAVKNSTGTDVLLTSGQKYTDRPAAEVTRIVTMTDDDGECEPACQIVIRVW